MQNVFLIGYMGCGKSSVARCLAEIKGIPFIETDTLIEEHAQMSISRIFKTQGETAFRQIESAVLKQITPGTLVATGGGLPCHNDNMAWMLKQGKVVYLKYTPQQLYDRLNPSTERSKRPLLENVDLLSFITSQLAEREPYYGKAHVTLEGNTLSVEEIASRLIPLLF